MQQQVAQVALGIDDNRRDAVQGGLFEQADAQSGLARAGHAGHHPVGGQVSRVIQQQLVGRLK